MPTRKPRLSQTERAKYFNDARQLREGGVELEIPEDLLEGRRAVDIVVARGGGSMVIESSNGGVHYAVWVRLVARYACMLLGCRVTTKWDSDISLNSYDDQALLCRLGLVEYSQEEVLNQQIENSLRFNHRGDMVEGVILATGIRPIPQAFRHGFLLPFRLTLEDQLENEISVEAELCVDWTAKPTRFTAQCGTGLYGFAAASRRAAVGQDLSGPRRRHAFPSDFNTIEGVPQHNARHAIADAEI
jgi:hypothetical protein